MVLPQKHRLRKRRDFAVVYQQGMRLSGQVLCLRLKRQSRSPSAPANQVQPTRIGISISQKVSKLAVVRNRLKRRIRAACRQLLPQLRPGWDVVIVVSTDATGPGGQPQPTDPSAAVPLAGVECDYWKFLQELKQLLEEAKILHGH